MTEVIWVDDSWWATRSPVGIHILNPSVTQLSAVRDLCSARGVLTLYCYKPIKGK